MNYPIWTAYLDEYPDKICVLTALPVGVFVIFACDSRQELFGFLKELAHPENAPVKMPKWAQEVVDNYNNHE